jgi:hypothetical protein
MTRSKPSTKAVLLATGIGLSVAAFAGSQPAAAAAQPYYQQNTCPAGAVYDQTYGCVLPGEGYWPYDYGYYGYPAYGGVREFGPGFGHGFGHSMGGGFGHGGGGGHH